MTRVAVLTPAGTGAIATLAVVGPAAWDAVRAGFRPANGKPLPDEPTPHRFWLGKLGEGVADEVVVAVKQLEPEPWVEVHCHGGRRVVRWAIEQFTRAGCIEVKWQELASKPTPVQGWAFDERALEPLTRAPTVRTASILLDQYHGAFARSVTYAVAALDRGDPAPAAALAQFALVGEHLVSPWRVVIAGAPNVGKSSLVNALAGYQRSVVAPVPGTTRDVVTVALAFDGWPVELADTAGLRDAADGLESEGIARAFGLLKRADLVVWVLDATAQAPVWPGDLGDAQLTVVNKTDLPPSWDLDAEPGTLRVSAVTGAGIPELASAIAASLVPTAPPPGAAVPFTPALAAQTEQAARFLATGNVGAAREALLRCLD